MVKMIKGQKLFIVRLGILLAHLRGVIPTFQTDDSNSQGLGYSYSLATIEEPTRAMTQLRNLARGHALSQGRNYLTMEDISTTYQSSFFDCFDGKSKNL